MFEITTGSLLKTNINVGAIPRVSVRNVDNGILGYFDTESIEEARHNENYISVNFFGNAFYQPYKSSLEMKVHCLKLKDRDFTQNSGLFVTSMLNKTFINESFSYGNQLSSSDLKNNSLHIQLPTKNNAIDFEFMESFISELEEERISELEEERISELAAYLKASGLDSYELSSEEQKALADFSSSDIGSENSIWQEFRLGDMFEIVGTKSLDSNAIEFERIGINFIGRTFEDNGIQGKISKQNFEPNEPFTITATVIGNYKYVKYQEEPYYCSQNINKITPKSNFTRWNKFIAYFVVANIQKFVSIYDGQQGGYKLDDIKGHLIKLPTKNNAIDYQLMETLIAAIQKLVIKDVVLYSQEKIQATRACITKSQR
ncbi:restriction endonuclease subunit S [Helicobacter sp. 12S02634-8]|uniref:restriction endonuclease subunit S n=1 Tax=Helicobacter sp. 12S02634-8 TaxID=1476199 RepID=UPI000BA6A230|nr:restriction endonuclease subunit S [Helicobacter sp. 12S02634-8]